MRETPESRAVLLKQKAAGQTVNSQATDVELAYLAGFMDGEGTFQIVRRKDYREGQHQAAVEVSNTDPTLIEECFKLYEKLGVTPHVRSLNTNERNPRHREAWIINIGRLTDIAVVCRALIPFLVGKKSRAELLLRYCESRLKYGVGRGGRRPWSGEELALVDSLSKLNRRGASETARATPPNVVKIQSDLGRNAETVAEMTTGVA
jgi:hypothetical protein